MDPYGNLRRQARNDSNHRKFFAVRELEIYGSANEVRVAILGPYTEIPGEVAYVVECCSPSKRKFFEATGSSYHAIALAVSMCQLFLWQLVLDHPQGLLEENGDLYEYWDINRPVHPLPPIDETHPRWRGNRRRASDYFGPIEDLDLP